MNGNKWFLAVVIAVCVLALVAVILGTALAFQLFRAWGVRENEDSSLGDFGEIFERHEAVEEPPMEVVEETPAVAEPVEMGDPLGILVPDEGDFNMRILESFDAVCQEQGIASILFVGSTGDPMELFDAAISMLENDGVSGIAICNMDPEVTEELAAVAAAYNVPVISIDAAMDAPRPEGVVAHIDSWGSVEDIAFELLMNLADLTGGADIKFGTMQPFSDDPIRDAVMDMYPEIEHLDWTSSGTADGSDQACRDTAAFMLENYDIDALVCVEPQTTNAAIIAREELGMDLPIVGFAPPSMVADLGCSNVVTVWQDPKATGELAARSLIGLLTGEVVFEEGALVDVRNGDSYRMEEVDGVLTMWVNALRIDASNAEELRGRE